MAKKENGGILPHIAAPFLVFGICAGILTVALIKPYDKLKLDLTYIQNYSFWLDLKLMLLTLKILLTPESTEGVGEGQTTALSDSGKDDKKQ